MGLMKGGALGDEIYKSPAIKQTRFKASDI